MTNFDNSIQSNLNAAMPSKDRSDKAGEPVPPKEALSRGLAVLEALNERQVSRLDAIATATGLAKPTLSYILELLARDGYVRHLPKRRGYSLGARVLDLSRGFGLADAAVAVAHPVMVSFTELHGWPLAIGTRDGNAMRVREETLTRSPLSISADIAFVGRRVGFLHSALGRAYLGFCPDDERREIVALHRAAARTAAEVASVRDLVRTIPVVTREGYAISAPARGDPAIGVGVPILCAGRVVACLTLRYLGKAMSHAAVVRRYVPQLQQAAAEVATLLEERNRRRLSA